MMSVVAQNAVFSARRSAKAQRTNRASTVIARAESQEDKATVSWASTSRAALLAGASALAISLTAAPVLAKETYGVYFYGEASEVVVPLLCRCGSR